MPGPRNILVTGGTSGIGLALAGKLSQKHRVMVTGRKMSEGLKTLIGDRPDLDFLPLDQSEPAAIPEILKAELKNKGWDRLDNAVLNAGTGYVNDPAEETAARIRATLTVNLTANIAIAHCLLPLLSASSGKLTFIGSTARKGAPDFASYAASKAGLHGFARCLKEEWRGRVAVQVLHPGPTRTDMHAKAGLELGRVRSLFADPAAMAQMIENNMARNRFAAHLGLVQYWSGGQFMGRGLR